MSTKRFKNKSIQKLRNSIQLLFLSLCLWIGIEFYFFVAFLASNGLNGSFHRPPGVEGFLPISSLMSVIYFLKSGSVHTFHPAGFFIFIAIVVISVVFAKSFCSWLCPVGFLSEMLSTLRKKIGIRKLVVHTWLDIPLRAIKYIILCLLLFAIVSMSTIALEAFLNGGYNIVCDIRMYDFFANISFVSVIVISILILLSFFIESFWCRYLCPYGAFLGVMGLFSPVKVKRNVQSCIDCGKCTKVCPSNIAVAKKNIILSDECTSCAQCVDVCPVENTLTFTFIPTKTTVNKKAIGFIIIGLFIAITGIAILTKHWYTSIPQESYFEFYKIRESLHHH